MRSEKPICAPPRFSEVSPNEEEEQEAKPHPEHDDKNTTTEETMSMFLLKTAPTCSDAMVDTFIWGVLLQFLKTAFQISVVHVVLEASHVLACPTGWKTIKQMEFLSNDIWTDL